MRDNTVNLRSAEAEEQRWQEIPPSMDQPSGDGSGHARRRRRFAKIVYVIVAIVIVAWVWSAVSSSMAWRAVFLSNNQVYFGHFWNVPFASTITLGDVYYLQVAQSDQQLSGESQSSLKLVKLGNEIHGPTDEMVIPISQILFWETLRSDSAIVKSIQNGNLQAGQ